MNTTCEIELWIFTGGFIGEHNGRNLHGEYIWKSRMAGNGRWVSRCWKTRLSKEPW